MKEAGTDYALVEFVSPPSEPLWAIFEEDNPRHEFFCFDDVMSPWAVSTASLAGYQAPTDDDIQRLLDASDTLLEAEYVYCHCEAGISRSTAAAYILHCIDLGPGFEEESLFKVLLLNRDARPSLLMVTIADRLLGRDGKMVDGLQKLDEFRSKIRGNTYRI
jgi:predicted protein tyrosine phosphatase